MRVEDAISADLVFQRERFGLEFDAVFSGDIWPHIHSSRLLLVRMAVFEDDFRVAYGKAVNVRDSSAENESVVIETEVGSVAEDDLTDLGPQAGLAVLDEAHAKFLGGSLYDL